MEKLNILVIEDNTDHQLAAREQLVEHNVKVVGSFPTALRLLGSRQLILQGASDSDYEGNFDVVLTDMELPIQNTVSFRDDGSHGTSASYGLIIALRAAQVGVKYVAMMTDTNHHGGPMSNALDMIASASWYEKDVANQMFKIGESKVLFVHAPTADNGRGKRVKQWRQVLEALMR